ncbi:hypothetical protein [Sinomonas albida]|uniref:hypothetical protein n=1 Tax=Sinomonas albida TaxID=369942 RepID=UPI001B3C99F2|nr:hypothetical protein [Sinomonas albida]
MNDFWENASILYKRVVFSGMALLGVGILLSIVANLAHVTWLLWASMAIVGLGLVTHLVGLGIRTRDTRRRLRAQRATQNPAQKPAQKPVQNPAQKPPRSR